MKKRTDLGWFFFYTTFLDVIVEHFIIEKYVLFFLYRVRYGWNCFVNTGSDRLLLCTHGGV